MPHVPGHIPDWLDRLLNATRDGFGVQQLPPGEHGQLDLKAPEQGRFRREWDTFDEGTYADRIAGSVGESVSGQVGSIQTDPYYVTREGAIMTLDADGRAYHVSPRVLAQLAAFKQATDDEQQDFIDSDTWQAISAVGRPEGPDYQVPEGETAPWHQYPLSELSPDLDLGAGYQLDPHTGRPIAEDNANLQVEHALPRVHTSSVLKGADPAPSGIALQDVWEEASLRDLTSMNRVGNMGKGASLKRFSPFAGPQSVMARIDPLAYMNYEQGGGLSASHVPYIEDDSTLTSAVHSLFNTQDDQGNWILPDIQAANLSLADSAQAAGFQLPTARGLRRGDESIAEGLRSTDHISDLVSTGDAVAMDRNVLAEALSKLPNPFSNPQQWIDDASFDSLRQSYAPDSLFAEPTSVGGQAPEEAYADVFDSISPRGWTGRLELPNPRGNTPWDKILGIGLPALGSGIAGAFWANAKWWRPARQAKIQAQAAAFAKAAAKAAGKAAPKAARAAARAAGAAGKVPGLGPLMIPLALGLTAASGDLDLRGMWSNIQGGGVDSPEDSFIGPVQDFRYEEPLSQEALMSALLKQSGNFARADATRTGY